MELKRKREIRQMKKYLPGYDGGTPTYAIGNLNDGLIKALNKANGYNEPSYYQTPGYYVTPTKRAAESTFGDQAGNIFTSGISFAGALGNSFSRVKGENEIMADAGISNSAVNGFVYQRQNDVNTRGELDELDRQNTNNTLNSAATGAAFGASVGSIIPGVGTAIGGIVGGFAGLVGGLFGSSSRKDRLRRKMIAAQQTIDRTNAYNAAGAHSNYLGQNYSYNHTNTQDDLLYGAKGGKDMFTLMPGYAEGYSVYTSDGIKTGHANSRVAFGETIYNPNTGDANIVKTGALNQDTNLSYLKPDDVVYGNHIDWRTGKTFRDEALPIAAVLEQLNK